MDVIAREIDDQELYALPLQDFGDLESAVTIDAHADPIAAMPLLIQAKLSPSMTPVQITQK
jgi:hypothetical protein